MAATDTPVRAESVDTTGNTPLKHLARMSERRFDGLVETLCGIIRQPSMPRPNAQRCQKCEEIYKGIRFLDQL